MAERTPQVAEILTPGAQGNLPLPLTSFVGREDALATVRRLLSTSRLLTLTGPGGVGKTRLALQVASMVQGRYPDGAWWVELAPLCDAGLVAQEVALTLRLPEDPTHSRLSSLGDYLRDRDLLLVLDNCEHFVAACAEFAGHLLRNCPRLRILATSREMLGIDGETVWSVPPLSLPCREGVPTLEDLAQSEAGRLFLERAQAIVPDLEMTESTRRAVAQICCRLDGIPLALELAVARLRIISVVQIAGRLDDRFRLLTGGSRLSLPHHQTLAATLDWSYDLLPRPEQLLFERLAAFAGGFCLEAAEAMAGNPDGQDAVPSTDVLDLLSRLVSKSLVIVVEGVQVRYRMLETIRQYALERLRASGDLERIRQRHLAYYLGLAEEAEAELLGAGQADWLRLLELEHDNLRTALSWSLESSSRDDGLRLAAALAAFWIRVGYLSEGSGWLQRTLAACREVSPVRIKALYQAGRLDQQSGRYEDALVHARQCLAVSRHLGHKWGMARAQGLMGWVAHWRGDRDAAASFLEEALILARDSGDKRTIARTLLIMGDLQLRRGALLQAENLLQEALGLYQGMGDGWGMAWAHGALGDLSRLRRDFPGAVSRLRLSLSLYQELDSKPEIPFPLETLALAAASQGHFTRAVHLWGAASAVRDSIHALLPPSYRADYAPALDKVRAALGDEAFAAGLAEGRALTLEQALDLAEVGASPGPGSAAPSPSSEPAAGRAYGLTPRELDVLRLVASGLTDAQVAEQLVISPRTVGKHLQSIYSKLYLPSRSAATRWAIEHHLA